MSDPPPEQISYALGWLCGDVDESQQHHRANSIGLLEGVISDLLARVERLERQNRRRRKARRVPPTEPS